MYIPREQLLRSPDSIAKQITIGGKTIAPIIARRRYKKIAIITTRTIPTNSPAFSSEMVPLEVPSAYLVNVQYEANVS